MARLQAFFRRHSTLLFLSCIALLAAIAAMQTLRLQYLEQRHAATFSDFGKAQMEFRFKAGRLQHDLAACKAAAQARPPSTRS